MSTKPTCETGGFVVRLFDGEATCPACGWDDRNAAELPGQPESARIPPHKPTPGVLVLGHDEGGDRHFLDGKPVHCGTGLQLLWWTGDRRAWLPCRFEWDPFTEPPCPLLYVTLPGRQGHEISTAIKYTHDLAVRWPITTRGAYLASYVDSLACRKCGSRNPSCGCPYTIGEVRHA